MKKLIPFLAVGLVLAVVSFVQATPIVYSVTYVDDISMAKSNWNGSMEIPKFNMANYQLKSIMISLTGNVLGSAKGESLDPSPAILMMNLRSDITLKRPDGSNLVVTIPVVSATDSLEGFDGTIDFGGASGRSYNNVHASKTETVTITSAADMNLFTGAGNITLPVSAVGASAFSGPGNLITNVQNDAASNVSVTYNYIWVPEPITMSLLCLGGLVGLIRRR